jgi:hypothetical protein
MLTLGKTREIAVEGRRALNDNGWTFGQSSYIYGFGLRTTLLIAQGIGFHHISLHPTSTT